MTATGTPPPVVVHRTQVHDGTVSALVLRCQGEIDSLNAHELRSAVADGLTRLGTSSTTSGDRRLVVDLRAVSFFSASAVTALLTGADASPAVAALRLVVGESRPVLIVIDALDLHSTFAIHRDLADALLPAA